MGRATAIGDEHITFALEMADAARRVLTAHAGGAPGVSVKPDRSLVTQIDLMIEAELRAMIADRFPSHGIIGEEATKRVINQIHFLGFHTRAVEENTWLFMR